MRSGKLDAVPARARLAGTRVERQRRAKRRSRRTQPLPGARRRTRGSGTWALGRVVPGHTKVTVLTCRERHVELSEPFIRKDRRPCPRTRAAPSGVGRRSPQAQALQHGRGQAGHPHAIDR